MATEAEITNPNLDALFEQLVCTFDPSEIKWRVTHTTQDLRRGAVIASQIHGRIPTASPRYSALLAAGGDRRRSR